jgi:O-methyltransferase
MTFQYQPADDFLSILRDERRDLLNRLRQTRFTQLKPGFSYGQVVPFASYQPWQDDQRFLELYEIVRSHTLVDVYRCYDLYLCASQAAEIDGSLVEVGVWKGGTGALIAACFGNAPVHLFDTFAGVAKADAEKDTMYGGGEHKDTSQEIVEALFERVGVAPNFHVGIFPDDTLSGLPERVALAHIDVDVYASAKGSFETIWPRVQPGGFVIFDDYGFFGCEGVAQAVNELRQSLRDAIFVHNLNGHGTFIKR